jgi:uncharacterized protein (TIGR02145 family)
VPSDAEWTTLENFLGGSSVAGGKMKSANGWYGGGNGSNSSGFTGLPGGYRYSNGSFNNVGVYGFWWSSTQSSSPFAWYRFLNYFGAYSFRANDDSAAGFSVRCVRD